VARMKLYLETSVVSYLLSRPSRDVIVRAHQEITRSFWETSLTAFDPHVSVVVLEEIRLGDARAAEARLAAVSEYPVLPVTPEADRLAEHYLRRGVLPRSAIRDAYHISLATLHAMDYLVTWNLRHIASAAVRRWLTEEHRRIGLPLLTIATPEEMMNP
jgi:predicted nucleic acid-binding protein